MKGQRILEQILLLQLEFGFEVNSVLIKYLYSIGARRSMFLLVLLCIPALVSAQNSSSADFVSGYEIDNLWVLVCAALVFFMQAGFLALEVGLVENVQSTSVALKNVIDFIVGSLAFYLVGFGLMFGHSFNGLIGTEFFLLAGVESNVQNLGKTFFLFQLAFSAAAITIVSGALAGRVGFISYLVASVVISIWIYPVFGHWVWGNSFVPGNTAWLGDLGFVDFAGSTVVHSVGGWIALSGAYIIGPRLGRYKLDGSIREVKPGNLAYSVLGVFILWLGWYGFNGGSTLDFNDQVDDIITNTSLAGAMGGLTAFLHCFLFQGKRDIYEKFIGGLLGGLVAITGSCNIVTSLSAIAIGCIAGIVHNYSFDFVIKKLKVDDAVGAIPVHGFCGLAGTLLLAFFAKSEALPLPRLEQFGIQLFGAVIAFVWAGGLGFLTFLLIKRFFGLRVSPLEERSGISIPGMIDDHENGQEDNFDAATLKELMGEK